MRPRLSASSVTSWVVRGCLADFRTASAAARKVIGKMITGQDELVAARSRSAARITWIRSVGQLGHHRPDIPDGSRHVVKDVIRHFRASRNAGTILPCYRPSAGRCRGRQVGLPGTPNGPSVVRQQGVGGGAGRQPWPPGTRMAMVSLAGRALSSPASSDEPLTATCGVLPRNGQRWPEPAAPRIPF
jgi:hypothetical protein